MNIRFGKGLGLGDCSSSIDERRHNQFDKTQHLIEPLIKDQHVRLSQICLITVGYSQQSLI